MNSTEEMPKREEVLGSRWPIMMELNSQTELRSKEVRAVLGFYLLSHLSKRTQVE